MEYLPLVIVALTLVSIVVGAVKMFQNKQLKPHRKAYWFFIFITIPLLGPFIYFSSFEYKRQYKKND